MYAEDAHGPCACRPLGASKPLNDRVEAETELGPTAALCDPEKIDVANVPGLLARCLEIILAVVQDNLKRHPRFLARL